jgi:hypothetical protein
MELMARAMETLAESRELLIKANEILARNPDLRFSGVSPRAALLDIFEMVAGGQFWPNVRLEGTRFAHHKDQQDNVSVTPANATAAERLTLDAMRHHAVSTCKAGSIQCQCQIVAATTISFMLSRLQRQYRVFFSLR